MEKNKFIKIKKRSKLNEDESSKKDESEAKPKFSGNDYERKQFERYKASLNKKKDWRRKSIRR